MPYRLLLADDSLTIQKVVELTFPDPDYELLAVGNGDKAMEALDSFHPDIVLADVVMPGPLGYDICEAVRKRPGGSHVPVVLLTGTFEPFDRARADRVGATAVVTKPFDSHALASLVKDLLLKAAAERAAAASAPAEPAAAPAEAPEEKEEKAPPAPEPRAVELFAPEPAEPEEIYATSAIPISSLATAFAPPPPPPAPAPEPPPPPPPFVASPPPPPVEVEPLSLEVEPLAPPPAVKEEEPLPPPPPFETAPSAGPAWELAEEAPVAAWEVPPAAGPEPPRPAPPREETTLPLGSASIPLAFEEEPLPPPPPFDAGEETVTFEPLEVEAASTPTAIVTPPREPEPVPEPPLFAREPEPPAAPEPMAFEPPESQPTTRIDFERELERAARGTREVPRLMPEEEPVPPPPAEETAPAEEVFSMPAAADETAVIGKPELPDLGQEEPVARDIDEDIAAFESSEAATETQPQPELEALAAGASLAELIPAAAPAAGVAKPLSDEEIERVARRVAELIGERVIRDIAWEVVPELAERLVRQRLAEIEKE